MLSTTPSHRPEPPGLREAIAAITSCIDAQRRESCSPAHHGERGPLERIADLLAQLSPSMRKEAAHKACELLLASSPTSPALLRCVEDIDQRFTGSRDRSEIVTALATQRLREALPILEVEELSILRRFARHDLAAVPDMAAAVSKRFLDELARSNCVVALQIHRMFPEVLPLLKSDSQFIDGSIKLIPLLFNPWAPQEAVRNASKFAEQIFPLTREQSLAYMAALERAFGAALEGGHWRTARSVTSCPSPQPSVGGVSQDEVQGFIRRMQALANKPIDILLSGQATARQAIVYVGNEETTSVSALMDEGFSRIRKRQPDFKESFESAVRSAMGASRQRPETLQQEIATVASLAALYALYSADERRAGEAPLYQRSQRWVTLKTAQVVAELWHLSAFGAGKLGGPELAGAGREEFAIFKQVHDAAVRVFDLDPILYSVPTALLEVWEMRYQQLPQISPQGLASPRAIQRVLLRMSMLTRVIEAQKALEGERYPEAFHIASSLVGIASMSPIFSAALGRKGVSSACAIMRQSCPSQSCVKAMLTSVLVRESRHGAENYDVLAPLAHELASFYEEAGNPRVTAKLKMLEQECAKKRPSPQAVAEAIAELKPKRLSRL